MSTPEPAPTHIPYEITSKEKTETFTPDGRFETVWRIGFKAPEGAHSFIVIPDSQFQPALVDQAIQAELDKIVGVAQLGPQPHPDNLAE